MTVIKLEALVRLSEAIARSHLEVQVATRHVRLAVRLLKTSIIRQATIIPKVVGYLLHAELIFTNSLYVLGVFHIDLSEMEILKLKVLTLQRLKLVKVAPALDQRLTVQMEGYHARDAFCLLVPAIQIMGISKPSWVSLPFFIYSCIGLVDWSLTNNFLGLFIIFLKAA